MEIEFSCIEIMNSITNPFLNPNQKKSPMINPEIHIKARHKYME